MRQIEAAQIEYQPGGKAIWVHSPRGATILRIQCTGEIKEHFGCTNIVSHADINVVGDIEICVPGNPISDE